MRPVTAHYRITRVDASGIVKIDVAICSVVCLIKWSYAHAAEQGAKGAAAAKGAIDHVLGLLRGR